MPSDLLGRRDVKMVTYTDLFMFCTMVISLISLILQIIKKK